MILLVVVTLSTASIAVFAISDKNNNSNIIGTQQLTQENTPSTTNMTSNKISTEISNNQQTMDHLTVFGVSSVPLSPNKAQKLATKFIKQPGAVAGTPKLVKQDNKKVYIVPVIYKAKKVGEIYIDAHSGKNLGGAGGAP